MAAGKPGDAAFSRKWKDAFANVKAHNMPPDDADQPPDGVRHRLLDAISKVKYLSSRDPGPFVIRRLTKFGYGNTLRDLFGVDASVARELPDEVPGEGYLNSLSPLQTEQYLGIANEVLDRILAPSGKPPAEVQERLFRETPAGGADPRETARKVARSLGRNAYRRPPSHSELDVLVGAFDLGRANKLDYTASLRLMLKAVLVSPQFLFITPSSDAPAGQTIVPLDDCQLASRLLDNCIMMWGAGLEDGNKHTREKFPFITAGKGGGSIRTGRFLADTSGNQGDLLTTLPACAGVPPDRPIGIATKQIKEMMGG